MLGVFLLGFGQPSSLEEVGNFIRNVTGREPSKEAVNLTVQRYNAIGGRSPFLEITQRQAEALHLALLQEGIENKVYMGMRYSKPTIREAIEEATQDKINYAVVITLAPQYSKMSVGKYLEEFQSAHTSFEKPFPYTHILSYGTHKFFLQALTDKIEKALSLTPRWQPSETPVIFTAHSLPITEQSDIQQYVRELEGASSEISNRLKLKKTSLAFQSKGSGKIRWLEPSLDEIIERYAKAREKRILVVPIGFVSDHLETLYDIDILAKKTAQNYGLDFRRAESLNDSPLFIELLKTLVMENLK